MKATPPSSPGLVLFVAVVAAFCMSFAGSSVNVALPLIGDDYHLGGVALNWVVTSFLLASSILVMPLGKLGDLWGRQRVFLAGMVVYAVGSVASWAAPGVEVLLVARITTGVGAAMAAATSMAVLVAAYPASQRGRVLGLNVAMVYFGLSAGPALGGLWIEVWGWRSLFALHGGLAVIVVVLMVFWMKGNDREQSRGTFDALGSLLFAGGMLLLLLGLSNLPGPLGLVLTAAGTVILVLFWVVETRASDPILPVALLTKNRVFAFSNMAALLSYSATFAVAFFLSLYLEVVRGLSPAAAGALLITQPLVQALVSPLTGRLSDKVSPGLLASLGMGLTALGLAGLAFLDSATPLGWVLAALVLLGLGFGIFSSPNTNSIMGSVSKSQLGVASATVSTMRSVGMMLSMGLALILLSLFLGQARVSPEAVLPFLAAQHWALGTSALLCALGIFASQARGRPSIGSAQQD